jgi:DNA polymerase-1
MLYLLDGHALAYRHHFAMISRPLTTKDGTIISAVFGFTRALMELIEKEKPHYLAVSFDEGLSGREQLYADYKGTREKMPDELAAQMSLILDVVRAFNIPTLMQSGYEADDVMGTIARQAEEQDTDVRIVTGDRDLLQLLSDRTSVRFSSTKPGASDEVYDVAKFRAEYGFEPLRLPDYKGLVGDTSDNIPGVKGIGDKTATTLLQQYATLDDLYAHIDLIKGANQRKLIEGRESAFLSRQLATIQRDVPITLDLAACVTHDFAREPVEALFRELEFGSLFAPLDRLASRAAQTTARAEKAQQLALFEMDVPVEPLPGTTTVLVDTPDKLAALVAALESAAWIAFDTETSSLSHVSAGLVGISLSVDGETGYYIPVGHVDGAQLPLETVIAAIRPALTNPRIAKAAHNALFDYAILHRHGIDIAPIGCDTMLVKWLLDPNSGENVRGNLGLKRLAKIELDLNMTPIERLIGSGKTQTTFDMTRIDSAAHYAAADALVTWRLVPRMQAYLDAEVPLPYDPLWRTDNPPTPADLFRALELPLIPVLAEMELNGVLLDTAYLADMSSRLGQQMTAIEQEIYTLAGRSFNINSPKQLNDILFDHLKLKAEGVRKTSHGFSTAADVLDNLRGSHPVVDKILEYRELTKLKGTYIDALPTLINPATGRVHTSFNQTGTSTGRLSSSDPNLQNIPIRTEIGRDVRAAFIAPPGWRLLSVDYSQVELRIMAHVAQEPYLLRAFAEGQDIHAATAAIVNNVPLDQVTKSQRIFAKRVNFGLLYGMGAFRLARDSELTLPEAKAFIKTYFERLPGVERYIEGAKQLAREQGFLTTLFGRRRRFPGLKSENHNLVGQAEREAINMPIQGTAADIMKRAMIDLVAALKARNLRARLLLQVHDELVLEVPDDQLHETGALVVEMMERAAQLDAPLRANAQAGDNWRDVGALS